MLQWTRPPVPRRWLLLRRRQPLFLWILLLVSLSALPRSNHHVLASVHHIGTCFAHFLYCYRSCEHEAEDRKHKKVAGDYFVPTHLWDASRGLNGVMLFKLSVEWSRLVLSAQRSVAKMKRRGNDSKTNGSGLKVGEDIGWPVKSEGRGIRTIQYPVEQTEGARDNFES